MPDPDGPTRRCHVDRQIFLNFVNNIENVTAFTVHFVTKCQNRKIAQPADFEKLLRLAFYTFGAVYHHDGRIDCRKGSVGVFGKIAMSGCINQIEAKLFKIKRHRRGRNGNTAILFHLHKI